GFTMPANLGKLHIKTDPTVDPNTADDVPPGFFDPTTDSTTADDPVTDSLIYVDETLALEPGSGNEAVATRGDRGPLIDLFLIIQNNVDAKLAALGGPPAQSLDELVHQVILDPGSASATALLPDLVRAYLANWSHEIDVGLRDWAAVGIASTKAIFDPGSGRFWQNEEGQNEGADVDPARADAEGGGGVFDVFLSELDDPNHDGATDDSFITQHVMPMLGIPPFLSDFRTAMTDFGSLVDDLVLAPTRLLLAPVKAAIAEVKQVI